MLHVNGCKMKVMIGTWNFVLMSLLLFCFRRFYLLSKTSRLSALRWIISGISPCTSATLHDAFRPLKKLALTSLSLHVSGHCPCVDSPGTLQSVEEWALLVTPQAWAAVTIENWVQQQEVKSVSLKGQSVISDARSPAFEDFKVLYFIFILPFAWFRHVTVSLNKYFIFSHIFPIYLAWLIQDIFVWHSNPLY